MKTILQIFFVFAVIISISLADIIHVPADVDSIQGGIDQAINGDTILVQPGIYYENINFKGKNVIVGSLTLTSGDTSYISQTIIDGNQNGSVVTFENGEDSTAILYGFTIYNGLYSKGGGIHISESSPTLLKLYIKNNFSSSEGSGYGGGIYFENSDSEISNIKLISNKSGGSHRGWPFGKGGGIFCINSELKLLDLLFIGNWAGRGGGGIYSKWSNISLHKVVIESNTSHVGGGIYCDSTNFILNNSMIHHNSTFTYSIGGGVSDGTGGGIALFNCINIQLENVGISENNSAIGGAIYCNNSNLELSKVDIINNTAYYTAGIFFNNNSTAIFDLINRCNIYNNLGCSYGDDLYSTCDSVIYVVVDTFTVSVPDEVDASPLNKFSFDILNSPDPEYQKLIQVAQDTLPGNISHVASLVASSDSTVFIAKGGDGLFAYKYEGSSLKLMGHVKTGNYARDVAISSNGTIFVVDFWEGLIAYNYEDTSFIEISRIDESGDYAAIAISPDGTIFIATHNSLRAYTFNGSSFINNANLGIDGDAENMVISSDGTIYLANAYDGLRVYSYDGITITNTAHANETDAWDLAISPEGTIFVASGDGMEIYNYDDGSLTNIGSIKDKWPWGKSIGISSDGNIFTLNTLNGLCVYNYDLGQLAKISEVNLAHCYTSKLEYFSDGIVFLVNPNLNEPVDELVVYKYSGTTSIEEKNNKLPNNFFLSQNYPNPFNPSTTITYQLPVSGKVSLTIYNLLGQKVWQRTIENHPAGQHEISINLSNHASGIYFYRLEAGGFVQTRKMVLLK